MTIPSKAPGQHFIDDFPRFGLPRYAGRFPDSPSDLSLSVITPSGETIDLTSTVLHTFHTEITADFHCVTTWSHADLTWSGASFKEVYHHLIEPAAGDSPIKTVALYAQDGYKTTLPLQDLLAENVLLADRLNGQPLSIEHGAPLRLIAPMHYGYKNIKHLNKIKLFTTEQDIKSGMYKFLDHPRARVSEEERGRLLPGWILRRLYRPMISGTRKKFKAALSGFRPDQFNR